MPPSSTVAPQKSILASKLKAKTSTLLKQNREKPAVVDTGGGLPPNIDGGIAKLVKCEFRPVKEGTNAGKPMFYAEGIVVSPDTAPNGVAIKGRRTRYMEFCFDTKTQAGKVTTEVEHLDNAMNMLKCLGADCSTVEQYSELEPIANALQEVGPYFTFRTWVGKPTKEFPNPRVNEVWIEACEYAGEAPAGEGTAPMVEDGTAAPEAEATAEEAPADDTPAEEPAADDTPAEEVDLDALAEVADNPKKSTAKAEAERQIEAIARDKGITTEQLSGLDNWAAVVEWIKENSGDAPTEEPAAPVEPKVGAVYKYQQLGKDGKPALGKDKKPVKPIEVEVVIVDKKKSMVTIKDLNSSKMILAADGKSSLLVPWDQLS